MQPNTAYPATPVLTGYLREQGYAVEQADASLELLLRLLSPAGLRACRKTLTASAGPRRARPESVRHFLHRFAAFERTIGPVLQFLQGRNPALAGRIASRRFCPEGPRFRTLHDLTRALGLRSETATLDRFFGPRNLEDHAKHLASLYVDDLADMLREGIDPDFGFSRYGEDQAVRVEQFATLRRRLDRAPTLVEQTMERIARDLCQRHNPDVIGLTVPFPGCLPAALRMARALRKARPAVRIVLGGGYVSTELRNLTDPGLFDFVDYVVLDDGREPLARLLDRLAGRRPAPRLIRTFLRNANGRVEFQTDPAAADPAHGAGGAPTFAGLDLDGYLSLCEIPNPMLRLWSDGRWNKLTLAHGCYWRRCRFCDTSLDYIRRYQPAPVPVLLDRMRRMIAESGQNGFHFTDEAAAPALLRRLAAGLLEQGLPVRWWGNIRFEPAFDSDLVRTLRDSGCIAVCGGLETVCDRTLRLMGKGICLGQALPVLARLAKNGILVHAYLMYGFPGQTERETVTALEIVRKLFRAGWLHSGYWHRFALTAHSEMAEHPEPYGIIPAPVVGSFAVNEIAFQDTADLPSVRMGPGLHKALYNYKLGLGLEEDVRSWFDFPVPRPSACPLPRAVR